MGMGMPNIHNKIPRPIRYLPWFCAQTHNGPSHVPS
jgi:hypothetical protein